MGPKPIFECYCGGQISYHSGYDVPSMKHLLMAECSKCCFDMISEPGEAPSEFLKRVRDSAQEKVDILNNLPNCGCGGKVAIVEIDYIDNVSGWYGRCESCGWCTKHKDTFKEVADTIHRMFQFDKKRALEYIKRVLFEGEEDQ